jgi:hypothetical protein
VAGVQSDVEVGVQRFRHLLTEERADAPARDPAHDLALQVPLGDAVIPRRRSWLPPRRLTGELGNDPVPVVQILSLHGRVEARQTRGVAHHVANKHAFLAVGCELGPVLGHRCIEVDQATVGAHEHA